MASTRRPSVKREANGGDYEPTLAAATKNLGDRVEIRIRDNGTGIPPEVKEKMFNPFFTTKPAGEGTGLGLSISHDIIVKQHGGSIEVDTKPGEFTEIGLFFRARRCSPPSGHDYSAFDADLGLALRMSALGGHRRLLKYCAKKRSYVMKVTSRSRNRL